MTVEQLINKLNKFSPTAKVCICVGDTPTWAHKVENGAYDGNECMYRQEPADEEFECDSNLIKCVYIEGRF